MALNSVANLIMTPARMLYAPLATAIPADTVLAGASWGAGWVEMGFTSAPFVMAVDREDADFPIEQSPTPVKRQTTALNMRFESTLAEIDMLLLALALGGTVATTAAGALQPGIDELTGGGLVHLTERMFGAEGSWANSTGVLLPVRFIIYKATAKLNGDLEFSKETPSGIAIQINALADMARAVGDRVYLLQKVTAPAT